MSFDVKWLVDERVIHLHIFDDLSSDEARLAYDAVQGYYDGGQQPVHLVIDHQGIQSFPLSLSSYSSVINGPTATRDDMRMVIVGDNKQASFMCRLLAYVVKMQFATAASVDEAMSMLTHDDSSLPQVSNA